MADHTKTASAPPTSRDSDPDALVGCLLGHLRRAEGLSLPELATNAQIDPTHLAALEVGLVSLDLGTARRLAPALGVPTREFLVSVEGIMRFREKAHDSETAGGACAASEAGHPQRAPRRPGLVNPG